MTAESWSSSQQVGFHVLGDIPSSEANSQAGREAWMWDFPRPCGCPCPVTARALSSQQLPGTGKALLGHSLAKAGLALGEDGAFPEQMKSSKTLSCQFEEAYAFCKFLGS